MKKSLLVLFTLILILSVSLAAVAGDQVLNSAPSPQMAYLYVSSNMIITDGELGKLSLTMPNIAPVVKNGAAFVPLRALAEIFGAEVNYDAVNKTAIVSCGNTEGEFPIGQNSYSVDGEIKTLPAATYLEKGVTYVPLRAVCENVLNLHVAYADGVISVSQSAVDLDSGTIAMVKEKLGAILKVGSSAKLNALVQEAIRNGDIMYGIKNESLRSGAAADFAAGDSEHGVQEPGAYVTNRQVVGIDEGDIVKVEGNKIFVAGASRVVMLEAEGENVNYVDEFAVAEGYIHEMYVKDGRVALIGGKNDNLYYIQEDAADKRSTYIFPPLGRAYTFVYVLDTNGEQLSENQYFEIEGSYTDSRLKDDQLFLISNYYVYGDGDIIPLYTDSAVSLAEQPLTVDNMYYSLRCPGSGYLNISTIDMDNRAAVKTTSAISNGYTIYMSANAIYAASHTWDDDDLYGTEILKFDIAESGETSLAAVGYVEGSIINQFALDEYKGNLRIATSDNAGNNIYILDPWLEIIGQLNGLAEDESIYAVRFIGDRGYLVTFRTVDPLFAFDLSDPTNPQMTGYLEIPGYSTYLHPIANDTVLGIGYDTQDIFVRDKNGRETVIGTRQAGIKLSLFDVSDPLAPRELDTEIIGDAYSYAEAAYDHKAFMANNAAGVYGFPASVSGDKDDYANGAVTFKVQNRRIDDLNFAAVKETDYDTDMYSQRLVYIGGTYYFISYGTVYTIDIEDGDCDAVLVIPKE